MSSYTVKSENEEVKKRNTELSTKRMVIIGLLGAISTVLMLMEFPIPLAPAFVKMDFSELTIILGGYMMGPVAGFCIIFIKIALNFMLNGTTTMGVGELANMIGSVSYMLPAVLIYRKGYTKKRMAISLIIGTLFVSGIALLSNMYLIFPIYAKLYGMNIDAIVAMGKATNPYVTDLFSMMLFSMLPFNLLKYGAVSVILFAINKRLDKIWM